MPIFGQKVAEILSDMTLDLFKKSPDPNYDRNLKYFE